MISVDDLTIWYKYVATMTFIKRSYMHFKQSIQEKASRFINGKAEIHVVPFYFHETGIYYQPIFDFDKCDSKAEILSFINNILLTNGNRINDIFVELSPNGIHVGFKYAFGPISVDDVKIIRSYVRENIEPRYIHLDAVSSIRFMAISRTPSMLKGKRMFAMEVSYFKRKNIHELRKYQQKLKTISPRFFHDQINLYLFLKGVKNILNAPDYVLRALDL